MHITVRAFGGRLLRAYCQVIYVLDRIDPADLLDVELAAAFV